MLLALRESQPEDPDTNLELAHLAARGPHADLTRRYYQSALGGLWRPEQAEQRHRVRLELIDFLLAHGERSRALSELLVLAAQLPQDVPAQEQVARMFLSVGEPRLALDHFLLALPRHPESAESLAGAGEAAFELGDYRRALRYLSAVPGPNTRVAELREVTQLVLTDDPLALRLDANDRHKRLLMALEKAMNRMNTCPNGPSAHARTSLKHLALPVETSSRPFGDRTRRSPEASSRMVSVSCIESSEPSKRAAMFHRHRSTGRSRSSAANTDSRNHDRPDRRRIATPSPPR